MSSVLPNRILLAEQLILSIVIVSLTGHAADSVNGFVSSVSATCLLAVSTSYLLLNLFLLITSLTSEEIHKSPLFLIYNFLFFNLFLASGIACIVTSKKFDSEEDRLIGSAGILGIVAALSSLIGGVVYSKNINVSQ